MLIIHGQNKLVLSGLLFLTLHVSIYAYTQGIAVFNPGDSLYSFFWTLTPPEAVNRGYYGLATIIAKNQGTNITTYQAKLDLKGFPLWRTLFGNSGYDMTLTFFNSKPDSIERCSNRFNSIPWLRSMSGYAEGKDYLIRFFFPVLPVSQPYTLYDYFTVLINDTMCIEFQVISDSTIIGSFINNRKTGNGKTVIYAKDAIAIQTTIKNSFRIKSIQINGTYEKLASGYMGFSLSNLNSNASYYGINLLDTTITDLSVQVKNITLSPPPPLSANYTDTVSWSFSDASKVDRCSLYVTLDSGAIWSFMGITTGTTSSFKWTAPPKQCANCFIKVRVIDKNGWKNEALSQKFAIVLSDAFLLKAYSFKSNSVILEWNPSQISIPKAKHLCIAYRKGSAITDITTPGIDTIHYNLVTTTDTISGLQTGAVYYFSAFVLDSLGAFHSPGGQSVAWALVQDITPPENTYVLRGNILNASSIILHWGPASNNDTTIDSIGIRYSTLNFPTSIKDSLSILIDKYTTADTSDTIISLSPNQGYYFSLFVANALGNWSNATQNTKLHIRTDSIGGQGVILGTDTQHVLNDSVLLWTIPRLQITFADTVYSWNGSPVKKGFVQTSPGFLFRKGTLPPSTALGMRITHRNIPSPLKATDQRVYRYNIYTGGWRVSTEQIVFDTAKHTLTTTNTDASLPFIVMIDTLKPIVGKHLNQQPTFAVNQRIIDTFSVSDNIENPLLYLLAGAGKNNYSDISIYIAPVFMTNNYLTTIPPYLADENSGLRSLFCVDDARNADTTNLSRKMLRTGTNCDDTTAHAMQWTPIVVTAAPENPSILTAISATGQPEPYNKQTERILQWLTNANNSSDALKWVEYDSALDSLFFVAPGKLFWLKSRNDRTLRFGRAVVPSLNDTFTAQLNENGWTDFSIPYKFDLYLDDILTATKKLAGNATDSIGIYRWLKSGNTYITDPIYLPGIADVGNPTDTIKGANGYSAYNSTAHSIPLKIPPTCIELSPILSREVLSYWNNPSAWSIKLNIIVNNSEMRSPIYCASRNTDNYPEYYPLSPSFSVVKTGVLDNENNILYGHAASGDLSNGGTKFDIICENTSTENAPITIYIEKKTGIPQDIKAGFFANTSGEEGLLFDSLQILCNPAQKITRYLIVGTEEYVNNIYLLLSSKLSFRAFSIPFARIIRIVYSIPYNTRMIQFIMYDLKGRKIQNKKIIIERMVSSKGSVSFTGSFASGLYIFEMKATVSGVNNQQISRQRVIYVK